MDTSPNDNDLQAIHALLAELTARIYRIERKLGMEPEIAHTVSPALSQRPSQTQTAPPVIKSAAPQVLPVEAVPPRAKVSATASVDLESRIGSHWLNRIGIAALLIGISYFLKFAFDSNWIGATGRVAIGLLAGIGVIVWSERFRSKGYQAFSYSLKAVGVGTLYLSLWAAFQVYNLIPSEAAFAAMLVVTAATAAMAWSQDAQLLAAFALIGGFATPMLLATGVNREAALFSYVALLDIATLVLVVYKPWRRLLVMSFAGTLLLYIGWYARFYTLEQMTLTLSFATLFFAIFAIAPLITLQPEGERPILASVPAVLAFVNAAVYFLEAYEMMEYVDKSRMAWFALALAAVYIFLSRQMQSRKLAAGATEILRLLHLAVALAFITIAIPIRLDAHWITIGWLVESAVLVWVAGRIKSDLLNLFALATLALGVARLLALDNFSADTLIFNMRMATYSIAVAALGFVAWHASRRNDEAGRAVAALSVIALNLLALVALTREVADYYGRQMSALRPQYGRWNLRLNDSWRSLEIERDFTYSALWMVYGTMLMVVGFVRRSAFVRWQALFLIAATIVKVFVYDVSELDRGYRIVSFIVLGALLLGISFVYQRDWLRLSARHNAQTKHVQPNNEGDTTIA